jgi:hypothetical protein
MAQGGGIRRRVGGLSKSVACRAVARVQPAFAQVGFDAAAFTRFASEGWWARQDAQDDLAYEAEISRSYLSQLEKGKFYVSLKIIAKLGQSSKQSPQNS